ncbi:hypothetical protein ZWY2020_006787 [Hordeum vulgare]|nr:hypothetical protein ZWY2020_006787 [Hordeum vulgare]
MRLMSRKDRGSAAAGESKDLIPNLKFSLETLGLNRNAPRDVITRDLISKIDLIMQIASGISMKTLDLDLYSLYNFPCSLLSNGSGNSIQYLDLCYCTLCPTVGLGCLRSLTRLHMYCTQITGDELWSMPKSHHFYFEGFIGEISLGGSLQVKTLCMICLRQTNIVCYARQSLVSIAPNMVNTPMLSSKFLHLKLLQISMGMAFSEFMIIFLYIAWGMLRFSESPSHDLRQIPQQRHDKLKSVTITGFCSAKSLVELICHILQNTTSLTALLWTPHVMLPGGGTESALAIRRYVAGKVPSMVKINILEHCSRSHVGESLVSTAKLS